jgi:hypothetical protein
MQRSRDSLTANKNLVHFERCHSVLLSVLAYKQGTTLYIAINGHITLWLARMQGQKWSTLHWWSFSWSGRKRVGFFLAYKGGRYFQCVSKWPSLWLTTWLTRRKIVDARLTLNVWIWQGEYRFLFCLLRMPLHHWWISVTNRHTE